MILQNKNIIVAGGSSGIGLATVKHLMNEGANVVAIGKNSEEDLPHANNQLQWVFGDLRKEDTIQQAIKVCIGHYKTIDGLLHVAGGDRKSVV